MDHLQFFSKFFKSLGNLEQELQQEVEEMYSNVFVMGLPRSGTTLLSQILYNNTDLFCTNNFMARFWETPLVGAKLSSLSITKKRLRSFDSFYGRTADIDQPHEFSKFWHKCLKVEDFRGYEPEKVSSRIDWRMLQSKILGINAIFNGGLVCKPMEFAGFHLNSLLQTFNRAVFVYLERDALEVTSSILRARKEAGEEKWWGSYPPAQFYESLRGENLLNQVAHQVCYFKAMYEGKFSESSGHSQLLRLHYRELCDSPNEALAKIKDAVRKNGGELTFEPLPAPLAKSGFLGSSEEVLQMKQALKEASRAYPQSMA